MNVNEVIDYLKRYVHAGMGELPVHILNMEDDLPDGDLRSGIVSHVELDMFDVEQGQVVSLMSWPNREADQKA